MGANKRVVWLVAGAAFGAIAVALVAVMVLFPSYYIPSEAMTPTLKVGTTIRTVRADGSAVDRGDIVVYDRIAGPVGQSVSRVVAVGGDTVSFDGGEVIVNGSPETGNYLQPGVQTRFPDIGLPPPSPIPDGSVYLLGDNRGNSQDSRFFGPVPADAVQARVVLTSGPSNGVLLAALVVAILAAIACLVAAYNANALEAPPPLDE